MFFNKTSVKRIVILAVFALALCIPIFVFSADFGLKVTAGKSGYSTGQNANIYVMVGNVMRVAFATLAFIFFGLTVYAGLRWITARGKEEFIERAKNTIEGAIWGLVIMSLAYGLATFIVNRLGPPTQEPSKTTEEFCVCREKCYEGETEDPFYERCSDPFIGCCGGGGTAPREEERKLLTENCCVYTTECEPVTTENEGFDCIDREGSLRSTACSNISDCALYFGSGKLGCCYAGAHMCFDNKTKADCSGIGNQFYEETSCIYVSGCK